MCLKTGHKSKMILEELKTDDITRKYLYEKVNAIYINNDKTINIEYKNDI